MPWKLILDSLYDYLKAHKASDLLLKGFADAGGINIADKTITCLTRGSESYDSVYDGGEGTCTIYIDMFAQYQSVDMSDGYAIINDLEKNVIGCVKDWASQNMPCEQVEVMEVRITNSGGNTDVERPIIGSYIAIDVDWSMRTL